MLFSDLYVMGSMEAGVHHGRKSNTSVVSLLRLLLVVTVGGILVVEVAAATGGLHPNSVQPCSMRDPAMDPTHEVRYGRDVVWQIPSNPKAVLLVGHGGGMESLQYFDPAPGCKQCYGLPEARTVVLESLKRQYAVICVTDASEESLVVSTIVKEWMARYSLDSLPLAAWGHSAGTYLITELTQTLSMRVIVLMNGPGTTEIEVLATPLNFPPTLFVYMPRDAGLPGLNVTDRDLEMMAMLSARGVEVAEAQCWPKALNPLFFTERTLCMSDEMSGAIFVALKSAGWIDSNGYLTKDPGLEDFEAVLSNANALPICAGSGQLCLIEHVTQELKMAFALHALTNDANNAIFPWLDSHVMSSSSVEKSDFETPFLSATV